jgi:hypothetical protein
MTKEKITECVGRLSLIRFFPQNRFAIAELARIVNELCVNDAEGDRLTDEALRRFDEWCGPVALRAFYWERVANRTGCETCHRYGVLENGRPCTCAMGRYRRNSNDQYRPYVPPRATPDELAASVAWSEELTAQDSERRRRVEG